ncbi:unnamed protein product, partial [Phaeothamnion confervicola]
MMPLPKEQFVNTLPMLQLFMPLFTTSPSALEPDRFWLLKPRALRLRQTPPAPPRRNVSGSQSGPAGHGDTLEAASPPYRRRLRRRQGRADLQFRPSPRRWRRRRLCGLAGGARRWLRGHPGAHGLAPADAASAQAHATSLAAVMAAGAAGSFGYWWAGQVDFAAAGSMAVGGMAGAAVGARIATRLSAVALKRALGVLMMSVAPMVPLREALLASVAGGGADGGGGGGGAATASDASNADAATHGGGRAGKSGDAAGAASSPLLPAAISGAGDGESEPRLSSTSQVDSSVDQPAGAPAAAFSSLSPVRMVFIGLGSGLLAGVFGVGGGVINIPAVALATDLSHLQCLGTSLAAMVLPAVTGAVAHRRTGSFLPAVALP